MSCFHCKQTFLQIKDLITHIKKKHDEIWKCGEEGCFRIFPMGRDLKKHLITRHLISKSAATTNIKRNTVFVQSSALISNTISTELYDSENENLNRIIEDENGVEIVVKRFLLELHNCSNINRSQVKLICIKVANSILEPLIQISKRKNMFDCFSKQLKLKLLEFSNEYKLKSTLHKEGKFVKPQTFIINSCIQPIQRKGRINYAVSEAKGATVTLPSLFKQFFQISDIFSDMISNMNALQNNRNSFCNFIQGHFWKDKIKTLKDKVVIPFNLYFDDWEPDNALGSHKKMNAIAATYVTFPTIPKKYSSYLENILVVQLFKTKDKMFGNQETYNDLVKQCIFLEKEGIDILVHNSPVRVHFVLGLILGDNLGLHEVLGFSKSFVSNYPCRFCKSHRTQMHSMTKCNPKLKRTIHNYEEDVLADNLSETGINHSCVFNIIPSFHATSNLAVDIMHDMYEGVCHYNLSYILKYLINEKKFFSLDTFNEKKKIFDYGVYDIGNICVPILADHISREKFNTSASEMRCIFNFLPLFIGEYVPKTDKVWKFVCEFIQILDILTDSEINPVKIDLLDVLIEKHHKFVINVFKEKLKPKYHFMVHYSHIIKLIGPVSNIWCMRLEGKHRELKQYSNSMSSRINLPLSLLTKQQLKMAKRAFFNTGFEDVFEPGPLSKDFFITSKENYPLFSIVKWVKINHIKFEPKTVFKTNEDFVEIKECLFNKNKIVFCVQPLQVVGWHTHFCAIEILKNDNSPYVYIEHTNINSLPTSIHVHKNGLFIRPKNF